MSEQPTRKGGPLRFLIWLATALFIAMLFYPLLMEILHRFTGIPPDSVP
jgi:hypothetical protein